MEKSLHTPEGVRDIYNVECGKMQTLKNQIEQVFQKYGYHDIQTPTFEYFDVFREEIGTTSSKDLYRFFDKDGNMLALRPDITPSIARASATLFSDEELPIRLCYTGNTFINHSSYQGRLKEVTQMGVELIGDDSVEADAELLSLAIECLKAVGIKDFQLSVGNVGFLMGLFQEAALTDEQEERALALINNRNPFGLEEYLEKIQINPETLEAFTALNDLVGGADILQKAENLSLNATSKNAIKRLQQIDQMLKLYGKEQDITYDLGMTGNYGYYTGVIFRVYTYGTGDAIIKGGRYDQLLEKFGKQAPSIGFAAVIDELMQAMMRQKLDISYSRKNILVLYEKNRTDAAISLANQWRDGGENVELIKKDPDRPMDAYLSYGKAYYAKTLVYLQNTGECTSYDLVTGRQQPMEEPI